MISRIEIKNFQSHKDTSIDFCGGTNALNGESDNGKTAVIRAIKWVCENRPLGTDKLNSNWNKNFKEKMSVKLFLDNGDWVERIRSKDRNGYSYCANGKVVDLDAIGTDVPQAVKDLLRLSDVNFQFQLDAPYLLSLPSSEASRYFNKIIHLDSIDKILSEADSDKRKLSAEKKVVEKDIDSCSKKLEELFWLDEAEALEKRIEKYEQIIGSKESLISELEDDCSRLEKYKASIIDLSEQESLLEEIEKIEILDFFGLEREVSAMQALMDDAESIEMELNTLQKSLPDVCPLCGSLVCKGGHNV